MKHSVVFLEYDPNGINRKITIESLKSVIEHCYFYDFELIHVKDVKGFVNAVNIGLSQAKGKYISFVANDVILKDYDWLKKFEREGLGGWREIPFFITGVNRPDFACWSISRDALIVVGGMDASFAEGYGFDDDDYVYRVREAGFPTYDARIQLEHKESMTYNTIFKDLKQDMTYRNENLFREKWKI